MAHFFNSHFLNTYAVHEPIKAIKIASNKRICNVISSDKMKKILQSYKDKKVDRIIKQNKVHTYLESNSWITGAVDLLYKVFPSSYIIHIVRDPATYIPSHLNKTYENLIRGVIKNAIPFWILNGYQAGDYKKNQWGKLSLEEQKAWYWFKSNNIIEKSLLKYPRSIQLRYEDVFDEKYSGLKKILKFIDLTPKDFNSAFLDLMPIHKTKKLKFQKSSSWDTSLKTKISDLCSPLLEKYGYMRLENR